LQAQRIAGALRSAPARVTSEVDRRCEGRAGHAAAVAAWDLRGPTARSRRRCRCPRSTGRAVVTAVMGKTLPPKTGGR